MHIGAPACWTRWAAELGVYGCGHLSVAAQRHEIRQVGVFVDGTQFRTKRARNDLALKVNCLAHACGGGRGITE
jgi:hypothetical protein